MATPRFPERIDLYSGSSQGASMQAPTPLFQRAEFDQVHHQLCQRQPGRDRAPLGIVANSISKIFGSTVSFAGSEFTAPV